MSCLRVIPERSFTLVKIQRLPSRTCKNWFLFGEFSSLYVISLLSLTSYILPLTLTIRTVVNSRDCPWGAVVIEHSSVEVNMSYLSFLVSSFLVYVHMVRMRSKTATTTMQYHYSTTADKTYKQKKEYKYKANTHEHVNEIQTQCRYTYICTSTHTDTHAHTHYTYQCNTNKTTSNYQLQLSILISPLVSPEAGAFSS